MINYIDTQKLLRSNSSETISEQCYAKCTNEWIDTSVEISHFGEEHANIEMNEPSASRSFYIKFENQDTRHQINLEGNQGHHGKAEILQDVGGGSINW